MQHGGLLFGSTTGSALAVWLDGDSLRVIGLLSKEVDLHDDLIFADCKTILEKLRAVKVAHTNREGNVGADMMVNWSCGIGAFKL